MTNREILSYLAGVIDSDGSITIVRSNAQRKGHYGKARAKWYYSICISLAQIEPEAVNLMRDYFKIKTHNCFVHGTYFYRTIVSCTLAYTIINKLEPFLRIKRRQAKIALKFFEFNLKDRPNEIHKVCYKSKNKDILTHIQTYRYSNKQIIKREIFRRKIRRLNHQKV